MSRTEDKEKKTRQRFDTTGMTEEEIEKQRKLRRKEKRSENKEKEQQRIEKLNEDLKNGLIEKNKLEKIYNEVKECRDRTFLTYVNMKAHDINEKKQLKIAS